MANYKYLFTQVEPDTVFKSDDYSDKDGVLINDFKVNTSFNQFTDFIELHYYSLDGRLLKTVPFYSNLQSAQDSETGADGTLNSVNLKTEEDLIKGEFPYGDVYLYYNFLSDPFTVDNSQSKFFIEEISPDRQEVRLLNTTVGNQELVAAVTQVKSLLDDVNAPQLVLNFGANRLLLVTNIDTLEYKGNTSVVVRLYNTLPEDLQVKDTLTVNTEVSDSVAYQSIAEVVPDEIKIPYLKGPNFNTDLEDNTAQPSQYLTINDVFNYPVTNSYYQVKSIFEEKGAEVGIDHTDFSSFINFSSAQERLENFQYKVNLIAVYQSQSNAILNANNTSAGITGSSEYYEGLINNILSNFDHYDRYLYYESGSYSWPKTNSVRPYTLAVGAATGSWFDNIILSASVYDNSNPNQLINTVPEFLREDPNNTKYNTFMHMVGQHFDNLWIYTKAVTEKYNTDNRLDFGLSKDLIEDALKNFGVKLYNSNKSTQDLFKMFTGESYDTGSESYVTQILSGSDITISEEDYRKQTYKRLYHNLPFILKTKGTERGFRALLSTFGVPSLYSSGSALNTGSLFLTQAGGTLSGSYNLGEYQYTTSSVDRIRIDNTGSIEGTTLSQYVSIVQRDNKYSNDLNVAEAGFSPTTYINNIIISASNAENFDIDQILGDPGLAYSSSYNALTGKASAYLLTENPNQDKYDLRDFIRLLKYYDNVLFKTIKDFIPARTNISTGVIIKPHLLERSKAKQVKPTFERHNEYTASIEVGTYSGSSGDSFGARDTYSTSYSANTMTSGGLATYNYHNHEEAKYDGEFSGSYIRLTNGELNKDNTYKKPNNVPTDYSIYIASSSDNFVEVSPSPTPTATPTVTPTASPAIVVSPSPTATPTATPTPSPTTVPSQNGETGRATSGGSDQAAINWFCDVCRETIYWSSATITGAQSAIFAGLTIYSDAGLTTLAPAGYYYSGEGVSGEFYVRYWNGSSWFGQYSTYVNSCQSPYSQCP